MDGDNAFLFIRQLWSVFLGDPSFGAVPYLWGGEFLE